MEDKSRRCLEVTPGCQEEPRISELMGILSGRIADVLKSTIQAGKCPDLHAIRYASTPKVECAQRTKSRSVEPQSIGDDLRLRVQSVEYKGCVDVRCILREGRRYAAERVSRTCTISGSSTWEHYLRTLPATSIEQAMVAATECDMTYADHGAHHDGSAQYTP